MTEPKDIAKAAYQDLKRTFRPGLARDRIALIQQIVRGKSVLDVGCVEHTTESEARPVWLHRAICDAAKEVVGLDYEEAAVRALREKGYQVVSGDATNFDLKRTFDVVVAGEILEHLLDVRGFLASAKRHLAPGGVLVMTVPNANSVNYFMQNMLYGYEVDGYDHVAFYTPLTMYNLLRKCGFNTKEMIFLQPATITHHRSLKDRLVVGAFGWVQLPFVLLRRSLCRQLAVVASPSA